LEAAEKRMQNYKDRGLSKEGQIELALKEKRKEEAERLEKEKQGNYALQVLQNRKKSYSFFFILLISGNDMK
jgi:hypothetical protein